MCSHACLMCEKICKSLCFLSLNTVILQEHSNCPIHRPRGPFIAPMTKRSILQHQRCQPPLFKQTIRKRVRWPGWTMLEMTCPASLSLYLFLPLSLFMFPGEEQARGQNACRFWQSHQNPPQPPFLPVDEL